MSERREEIEEEDLACLRQRDVPVPPLASRTERCRRCGAKVWIREHVYAQAYQCMPCVVGDREEKIELRVHGSTREELRGYGWSDEEIDRALLDMGRAVKEVRGE